MPTSGEHDKAIAILHKKSSRSETADGDDRTNTSSQIFPSMASTDENDKDKILPPETSATNISSVEDDRAATLPPETSTNVLTDEDDRAATLPPETWSAINLGVKLRIVVHVEAGTMHRQNIM